jgi:hypothetical protein
MDRLVQRGLLRGAARLASGVLFLFGCAASPASLSSAAINTALAEGVAAARRSQGQCFTYCPRGRYCDRQTGLCERIPCDGTCHSDERCLVEGLRHRCVSVAGVRADDPRLAPLPLPPEDQPPPPPPQPPWMP